MILSNRASFFLLSVILLSLVDYSYLVFMGLYNGHVASFGGYGYPDGSLSLVKLTISVFFISILSYLVPLRVNSPSSFTLGIYYYVAIVPYLSLYSISLTPTSTVNYIDMLSIVIFFVITKFFLDGNNNGKVKINRTQENKNIDATSVGIILISLLVIVYLYFVFGRASSIALSDILDVYGQRDAFKEQAGVLGFIMSGYVVYGAVPFLIYVYKKNNNFNYIYVSFVIGFLVFLTTGHKLFLGSVILSVFAMVRFKHNFTQAYIGLFVCVIALISILANLFGSYLMMSLFVRRMLIIPAQLFGLFYEHVGREGYNYLAKYTSSFTGHESISIAHEIGNKYYRVGSSGNNGIISDAYANFGIIGVVLYSVMFVVLFKYIDGFNKETNFLITPLFAGLAISLTNSSLIAVFVYQISMLLMVFYVYNHLKKLRAGGER